MGLISMETRRKIFNNNIGLEHKFTKLIKGILGNQFIGQDPIKDVENGTDFLLLKAEPFTIGARLRRYEYFKYKDEFTIRWELPTGNRTEIDKINDGLVDYILYGFVDREEKKIIQYFIGDLNIFRQANILPIAVKPNNPRDSDLAIYKLNHFPNNFILKFWPKAIKYQMNLGL